MYGMGRDLVWFRMPCGLRAARCQPLTFPVKGSGWGQQPASRPLPSGNSAFGTPHHTAWLRCHLWLKPLRSCARAHTHLRFYCREAFKPSATICAILQLFGLYVAAFPCLRHGAGWCTQAGWGGGGVAAVSPSPVPPIPLPLVLLPLVRAPCLGRRTLQATSWGAAPWEASSRASPAGLASHQ